jgi:hypothetical protein
MRIDPDALRDVCRAIHAKMAEVVFGTSGVDALFQIMEVLWRVYRHVEPTRLAGPVIVYRVVESSAPTPFVKQATSCSDMNLLIDKMSAGFALEVQASGDILLHGWEAVNIDELRRVAVVYELRAGQESFLAGDQQKQVIKLDRAAVSQFSVDTFNTLREALRAYAGERIRHSSCPMFDRAWADPNRLFFHAAPEEEMRQSLTEFLKVRLGGEYEVRPEQVMDESHEVDIKVTQVLGNRLGIIEIKWLGDSKAASGKLTSHRDDRARKGARQLSDYLDQNKVQAPRHIANGYYVIIDARRRGLREDSMTISKQDALHYENLEIAFDPKFHEFRDDYDPPFRMFAEPLYTA